MGWSSPYQGVPAALLLVLMLTPTLQQQLLQLPSWLSSYGRTIRDTKPLGELTESVAATVLDRLKLIAHDSQRPDSIDVTNLTIRGHHNPNALIFSPASPARISETDLPGDEIFTIMATDADQGQTVTYSILDSYPPGCSDYFNLNVRTGRVSLGRPLYSSGFDFCRIMFMVQNYSVMPNSSSSLVQGEIEIYRNVLPILIIRDKMISIPETTGPNVVITTVIAIDQNARNVDSGNVTVRLIGDGNVQDYFQLDRLTGEISTIQQDLTRAQDEYVARIEASDKGTSPNTAVGVVKIVILRNLERPQFTETDITRRVYEDDSTASIIFTATAFDNDRDGAQNTLSFSLSGDSNTLSYFTLQPASLVSTGRYTVSMTYLKALYLDNADTPTYRMTLTVSDNGNPSQSSTVPVTINVIRNLQPPTFHNALYVVHVSNLTPVNDVIRIITATDTDTDPKYNTDSLVYSILPSTTPQTKNFRIDPSTGALSLAQPINTETASSFTLIIMATDGGTPIRRGYTTVYVEVNRNQNDPSS